MSTSTPQNPQGLAQFTLDFVPALVVGVALELDLFSAIEAGHQTIKQLAARSGASPRGVGPLLYTLASVGLLDQEGERFFLQPLASTYLVKSKPTYMGPMVRHQILQLQHWWKLGQAVLAGTTPLAPVEGDIDNGAFFGAFVEGLLAMNAPAAREVAEWLAGHLSDVPARALDVGCGSAVWSLALAETMPSVRVVAVDREKVLDEVARPCIERAGLLERYQLKAGNFRRLKLEENFDVVFLGHILHNEGRQASQTLLKRLHRCLKPGGIVVVAEIVASEPRSQNLAANLFDLNMLVWTEKGCVFQAKELEEMLAEAGFKDSHWLPTTSPSPILVAFTG